MKIANLGVQVSPPLQEVKSARINVVEMMDPEKTTVVLNIIGQGQFEVNSRRAGSQVEVRETDNVKILLLSSNNPTSLVSAKVMADGAYAGFFCVITEGVPGVHLDPLDYAIPALDKLTTVPEYVGVPNSATLERVNPTTLVLSPVGPLEFAAGNPSDPNNYHLYSVDTYNDVLSVYAYAAGGMVQNQNIKIARPTSVFASLDPSIDKDWETLVVTSHSKGKVHVFIGEARERSALISVSLPTFAFAMSGRIYVGHSEGKVQPFNKDGVSTGPAVEYNFGPLMDFCPTSSPDGESTGGYLVFAKGVVQVDATLAELSRKELGVNLQKAAADDTGVYVTAGCEGFIYRLSLDLSSSTKIYTQTDNPMLVSICIHENNLFVSDLENGKVTKLSMAGGVRGGVTMPNAMLVSGIASRNGELFFTKGYPEFQTRYLENDTIPDPFVFRDFSGVRLGSKYVSNTVTVSGINEPTSLNHGPTPYDTLVELYVNDVKVSAGHKVKYGDEVRYEIPVIPAEFDAVIEIPFFIGEVFSVPKIVTEPNLGGPRLFDTAFVTNSLVSETSHSFDPVTIAGLYIPNMTLELGPNLTAEVNNVSTASPVSIKNKDTFTVIADLSSTPDGTLFTSYVKVIETGTVYPISLYVDKRQTPGPRPGGVLTNYDQTDPIPRALGTWYTYSERAIRDGSLTISGNIDNLTVQVNGQDVSLPTFDIKFGDLLQYRIKSVNFNTGYSSVTFSDGLYSFRRRNVTEYDTQVNPFYFDPIRIEDLYVYYWSNVVTLDGADPTLDLYFEIPRGMAVRITRQNGPDVDSTLFSSDPSEQPAGSRFDEYGQSLNPGFTKFKVRTGDTVQLGYYSLPKVVPGYQLAPLTRVSRYITDWKINLSALKGPEFIQRYVFVGDRDRLGVTQARDQVLYLIASTRTAQPMRDAIKMLLSGRQPQLVQQNVQLKSSTEKPAFEALPYSVYSSFEQDMEFLGVKQWSVPAVMHHENLGVFFNMQTPSQFHETNYSMGAEPQKNSVLSVTSVGPKAFTQIRNKLSVLNQVAELVKLDTPSISFIAPQQWMPFVGNSTHDLEANKPQRFRSTLHTLSTSDFYNYGYTFTEISAGDPEPLPLSQNRGNLIVLDGLGAERRPTYSGMSNQFDPFSWTTVNFPLHTVKSQEFIHYPFWTFLFQNGAEFMTFGTQFTPSVEVEFVPGLNSGLDETGTETDIKVAERVSNSSLAPLSQNLEFHPIRIKAVAAKPIPVPVGTYSQQVMDSLPFEIFDRHQEITDISGYYATEQAAKDYLTSQGYPSNKAHATFFEGRGWAPVVDVEQIDMCPIWMEEQKKAQEEQPDGTVPEETLSQEQIAAIEAAESLPTVIRLD